MSSYTSWDGCWRRLHCYCPGTAALQHLLPSHSQTLPTEDGREGKRASPEEPAKALRAGQAGGGGCGVPHPRAHVEDECKGVEHEGKVAARHEPGRRGQAGEAH